MDPVIMKDKNPTPKEILFILEGLQSVAHVRAIEWSPRQILELDWGAVFRLAREQRVLGLLGHALEMGGFWPLLPPPVREEIEKGTLEYNRVMLIKKWQFTAVHRLCSEQNIPIIPYKGAALIFTVFKERPFRYMRDIDFFVREQDVAALYPVLLKQGFKKTAAPYPNRWQGEILREIYFAPSGRESLLKQGWDLDLHRQARYHAAEEIVSLDVQEIWARAKPRTVDCGEVFFLDDVDHVLLLLLHAVELYDPHFSQVMDIALLMKSAAVRKEDLMVRLPSPLARETRALLERVIDAIEEFLSPSKRSSDFSENAADFFGLFFYNQKKIHTVPISFSGWKRFAQNLKAIKSIRKKIVFTAGFFVPNPEYYELHGKRGAGMCFEHWQQLCLRVLSATFRPLV